MAARTIGRNFNLDEFYVRNINPCDEGANGEVWDAWHRESYERVAIKMLKYRVTQDKFENEMKQMQEASSQLSAVTVWGYISKHEHGVTYKGIVSKFMPCGSIHDVLHKHQITIPKCLAYRILGEISAAMHRLHNIGDDQRLLHLDLKPSNVMLDEDLHAKLADFGGSVLATVTRERNGPNQRDSGVHSLQYVDPLFLQSTIDRTAGSDVYSFAIMMWEILSGRRPDPATNNLQTFRELVIAGSRPPMCHISPDLHSIEIRNLLQRAWSLNLDQRPSFATIRDTIKSIKFTERELSEAVINVKQEMLQRLGQGDSFTVSKDEYTILFSDALTRPADGNGAQPIHNPAQRQPLPAILGEPSGDRHPDSIDDGQPRVTDAHCSRLGQNLHYTDGWEVLAYRIGLSQTIVDNIREDLPRASQRKVELFQQWKNKNGGSNAMVRDLIRAMRRARVAIDCWDFLDPDRAIRRELDQQR